MSENVRQFILLPKDGLRPLANDSRNALLSLPVTRSTASPVSGYLAAAGGDVDFIDSQLNSL